MMKLNDKFELLGLGREQLEDYVLSIGEPSFRGRQIHQWIYKKEVGSFYDMSDLPRDLRERLDAMAVVSIPRVLKQRVAGDGTRKFLVEFQDKKRVETVLIPHNEGKDSRYTICVSTQVGCPVRCAFCATGQSGFHRNLKHYEMVGQFLGSSRELKRRLKTYPEPLITNVVYMGMGEPLLNYDEVVRSIHTLNDPRGINIGQRHITVSTAGEADGIERLAQEGLQITLAVSLHACDDELRNHLVPMNRKYPLKNLLCAVERYAERTHRRVTFEYVMLDNVNTSKKDAENMVKLVKPLLANVNLIPYNEVKGLPYRKPEPQTIKQFAAWLLEGGLNVTLREEKGADIEAACGQLAVIKG